MNLNQIVVGLKMKNVTDGEKFVNSQIHTIELNLLDTDYLSLIRSQLKISGDTIKIPFSLTSNAENEVQFYFNANECTFAQKLKGTLTYMIKVINLKIIIIKYAFYHVVLLTKTNYIEQ